MLVLLQDEVAVLFDEVPEDLGLWPRPIQVGPSLIHSAPDLWVSAVNVAEYV
jgi:hypothetical protein